MILFKHFNTFINFFYRYGFQPITVIKKEWINVLNWFILAMKFDNELTVSKIETLFRILLYLFIPFYYHVFPVSGLSSSWAVSGSASPRPVQGGAAAATRCRAVEVLARARGHGAQGDPPPGGPSRGCSQDRDIGLRLKHMNAVSGDINL